MSAHHAIGILDLVEVIFGSGHDDDEELRGRSGSVKGSSMDRKESRRREEEKNDQGSAY